MKNKSPQMRDAIEKIFPGTMKAVEGKKCPLCDEPIGEFKDELSVREYEISGVCQDCQDTIWRQ